MLHTPALRPSCTCSSGKVSQEERASRSPVLRPHGISFQQHSLRYALGKKATAPIYKFLVCTNTEADALSATLRTDAHKTADVS